MAAATLPVKPAPKRPDPKARPSVGMGPRFSLKNQDPGREYHWANKNPDSEYNVEYYEGLGYEMVRSHPDGVQLANGRPPAAEAPIERLGHVLMSISKEDKERLFLYGEDGERGQKFADLQEQRLVDRRKGGADPLRGLKGLMGPAGPYVRVEESISPAMPELA